LSYTPSAASPQIRAGTLVEHNRDGPAPRAHDNTTHAGSTQYTPGRPV